MKLHLHFFRIVLILVACVAGNSAFSQQKALAEQVKSATTLQVLQGNNAQDAIPGAVSHINYINPVSSNVDFSKSGSKGLLLDNGPFVTHPGGGPGGSDYSMLESPDINFGFGNQQTIPNYVGDDFSVTGTWTIDSLVFFGYQTGSSTTSTFTGLFVEIWDGEPGVAGSSVIWGDMTTSILSDSYFSNCYRGSDLSNTTRPIMRIVAYITGLSLPAGDYWIAWSATGSLSSGPWVPPITIPGQFNTGNAIQYTATAGAWAPILDGTNPKGLPFLIYGTSPTLAPPTNLAATVDGQDVHLTWDAPAGGTIEELIYDDDTPSGSYSYIGYTMSSQMSPSGPCKILKLKYYTTVTDPLIAGFEPRVFNWDVTQPGTTILYETTADAVDGGWMEVDISAENILVGGDFMVGFGSIQDGVYMGYNTTDNGRAWDYDNASATWAQWNETYFIRAIVEYSKGDVAELSPVITPNKTRISRDKMIDHPRGPAIANTKAPIPSLGTLALLGYNAYREGTKLNTSVITDLFYDDLTVAPGTYNYTVTAVYDAGESVPTDPVEVQIFGVSIDEIGKQAIQVFPNPASSIVNVVSDLDITNIEVLSYSGQTIFSNQNIDARTCRINVAGLFNGVYLLRVTTSQDIRTAKITVTH
jgi:hypothetical protein